METLLLNNRSKNDLSILLDFANQKGIDLRIAPKTGLKAPVVVVKPKISKQKQIMQLSKEINKAGSKKAFAKLGLDYDSYSRQ
jgi:hypothetical protein